MDEIENIKTIKKLVKIFAVLFLLILILGFITKIIKANYILNAIPNMIITFLIAIESLIAIILVPMTIIYIYYKFRNFINSKIYISKNTEYVRDIELKYSPAIISLILDLQISYFKDYTATILYLCYRKYIELFTENDEIKFKIIEDNVQDLNPHEQYVYRCIAGSGFNETKFQRLIIEDAINLQLILKKNGKLKRTMKGEREAKIWKGFKNYIQDYTLISDKDIEHIAILNDYIPYAIALDEAKSIEKFIAKDDNYRNLIYRFSNTRGT